MAKPHYLNFESCAPVNKKMNVKRLLKQAQFHGLNKLDDAKYRWIWILSLLWLFFASSIIVTTLVRRFLDRPTFLARMEKERLYMEFPSVQVCPEVVYQDYKVDAFMAELKFPPNLNMSYMKGIMYQLAAFYSPDVKYNVQELTKIQRLLEYNRIDVHTAAKAMTTTCEETLMSDILHNGIHNKMRGVSHYTTTVGFQSGLILAVNLSEPLLDVDLTYKWMSINGGRSYIDATVNGTPLSPGMEVWFGHYNEGHHINQDAVNLNNQLRGCRLTSERLRFFPVYHKKYCHLECEISHVLKRCRCAMVTHPVPLGIPLCRAIFLPCARLALTSFDKNTCGCAHTCDADKDYAEITTFRLMQHTNNIDQFYDDLDYTKISIVRVFVAKREVKTKSRRAYFSLVDLVGQLGGIFNVFFGCSLLSIFEIVQIIKYGCNYFMEKRNKHEKYLKAKERDHKKINVKKVTFKKETTKGRNKKVILSVA